MSLGINNRITNTREQPSIFSRGNTLYVGGTGGGNYTKIQDAINDSVDGDTVFVFDYSSPYVENIVVDKSINLIGENKNTTVIDGDGNLDVVNISADWVNISGFTIGNSGDESFDVGINIRSNSNTITGNTITANHEYGIYLIGSSNTITGNTISNNDEGIFFLSSLSNTIKGNNISNNELSIGLGDSSSNTITGNTISGNIFGIILYDSSDNTITGNIISGNDYYGIYLWDSMRNNIFKNNFIDNERDAFFESYSLKDLLLKRNQWKQNYWNRPQILPKLIFGTIEIMEDFFYITWFNIDWRPALKPYDI